MCPPQNDPGVTKNCCLHVFLFIVGTNFLDGFVCDAGVARLAELLALSRHNCQFKRLSKQTAMTCAQYEIPDDVCMRGCLHSPIHHPVHIPVLHAPQPKVTTRVRERRATPEDAGSWSRRRRRSRRIIIDRHIKHAVKRCPWFHPVHFRIPATAAACLSDFR